MKISHRWLARHLVNMPGPQSVADALLQMGIEISAMQGWGDSYACVELVEIRAREPHPNADHLSVVTVRRGDGTESIVVTGADNGFPGDRVWYAPPGTLLPDGRVLQTVLMRGIPSPGMLLSASELGFHDTTGDLWLYHGDLAPGSVFLDAVGGTDTVYELELTPNLAVFDQSVVGIARELAAVLHLTLRPLAPPYKYGDATDLVRVQASDACPLYGLSAFDVRNLTSSPLWLQALLLSIGVRVIHPLVDITNFILWDLGQPLHAFDRDKVVLPIAVRLAKPGEQLLMLDGTDRSLSPEDLVIADQEGPIALAGIMGGQRTAIGPSTEHVLVESAHFESTRIFRSMRRHHFMSDAALHFGKGTDPAILPVAAQATRELLESFGGQVAIGPSVMVGSEPNLRKIRLEPERIRSLLGVDWSVEVIEDALKRLRFDVHDGWVTVPSNRHDVLMTEDLCEEVARVLGLDAIPVTLPISAATPGTRDPRVSFEERLRDLLAEAGYWEVVTRPFWSSARSILEMAVPGETIRLTNPLRDEEEELRTSLLPHVLEVVGYNRARRDQPISVFEIAPVYQKQQGKPEEIMQLAVAETLEEYPQYPKGQDLGIYRLKGTLEWVNHRLNLRVAESLDAAVPDFMHPGRSVALVDHRRQVVGFLGELRPRLAVHFHAKRIAVLSLWSIGVAPNAATGIVPSPSRYPEVLRDLSLLIPENTHYGTIAAQIEANRPNDLKSFRLIDVFAGEWGRSMTVRMVFQSREKTLTDSEVDGQIGLLLGNLAQRQITIRER
ncbi:MAG: phenylalanine--tRNA ligase subunit beta [Sulfobacillus sp.]